MFFSFESGLLTWRRGGLVCLAHNTKLTEVLDSRKLSPISQQTFSDLKEEFIENDKKIKCLESRLKIMASELDKYQQIIAIPGIGLITSTALIASIGNGSYFENGRQLSARLGLVPRQASSGGKEKLLGISKRGDIYLRTLLIQGARAVLNTKLRFTTNQRSQSFILCKLYFLIPVNHA